MTHLLDTSALLAHALRENGWEEVETLLRDGAVIAGISAITLYEADRRLVQIGVTAADRRAFAEDYTALLGTVAPVDEFVVKAASLLREAATARIATVDILIAATARVHGATLVHRDTHFRAIPARHLKQLVLPGK